MNRVCLDNIQNQFETQMQISQYFDHPRLEWSYQLNIMLWEYQCVKFENNLMITKLVVEWRDSGRYEFHKYISGITFRTTMVSNVLP